MVCSGQPQTWVNTVLGSIRAGTGLRAKSSTGGRPITPRRSASVRIANQKAAFAARISGRLYIGRLAWGVITGVMPCADAARQPTRRARERGGARAAYATRSGSEPPGFLSVDLDQCYLAAGTLSRSREGEFVSRPRLWLNQTEQRWRIP